MTSHPGLDLKLEFQIGHAWTITILNLRINRRMTTGRKTQLADLPWCLNPAGHSHHRCRVALALGSENRPQTKIFIISQLIGLQHQPGRLRHAQSLQMANNLFRLTNITDTIARIATNNRYTSSRSYNKYSRHSPTGRHPSHSHACNSGACSISTQDRLSFPLGSSAYSLYILSLFDPKVGRIGYICRRKTIFYEP